MEQKFDLKAIMEYYSLDFDRVAVACFPSLKYKRQALERVLKGESTLNTDQLQALAKSAGVLVSDLFMVSDWKGYAQNGIISLVNGDFEVKLNYNGAWLSLYKNGQLLEQQVSSTFMSFHDFLKHITKLISKYK